MSLSVPSQATPLVARPLFEVRGDNDNRNKPLGVELQKDAMQVVIDEIRNQTGNTVKPSSISIRVLPEMKEFGIDSIESLANAISSRVAGVRDKLVSAATRNDTSFCRQGQKEAWEKSILPMFNERQKVRIWSAASATGEEAYTMGIFADEADLLDRVEIIGSDISKDAIQKAQLGIYNEKDFTKYGAKAGMMIPVNGGESRKDHYFKRGASGEFILDLKIKSRVRFENKNLLELSDKEFSFKQDVIFCRNVLEYFDQEDISKILHSLFANLADGGVLVTASSDIVDVEMALGDSVERVAPGIFRKVPESERQSIPGVSYNQIAA